MVEDLAVSGTLPSSEFWETLLSFLIGLVFLGTKSMHLSTPHRNIAKSLCLSVAFSPVCRSLGGQVNCVVICVQGLGRLLYIHAGVREVLSE
jgi:hypothetical protein